MELSGGWELRLETQDRAGLGDLGPHLLSVHCTS